MDVARMHSYIYCLVILCLQYGTILPCKRTPYYTSCHLVERPRVDLESYENIFLRLRAPTKQGRTWVDKPTPSRPEIIGDDKEICGAPKVDVRSSIFHGSDAPERAWPWQVLINAEHKFCSGVLISDSWVVTVAHCFIGIQSLILGRNDLERWTEFAVERSVALKVPHPNYDSATKESDIGLIKLSSAVSFNDFVKPICIQRSSAADFIYPETCYVTGWGLQSPAEKRLSRHLQQLKVSIMQHNSCRFLWSLRGITIHSGHVCLEFNRIVPSSGVCSGDSGGPLSCEMNGKFVLLGLGSFVEKGCMKKQLPDVFTRLSDYIDWIDQTITKYSAHPTSKETVLTKQTIKT